jgi:hypothetical protein
VKLKNFCTAKETVMKTKETAYRMGEYVVSYTSGKGLITRIYRKLKKLNSQRSNNLINK